MDVITAIRTVRVVRSYRPPALTEDELRALADAARKTGSSKNQQRWDFITIRDQESLRRLSGTTIYAKHLPSAGGAIALIVPAPNPDHARSVLWDLGRAAQNIILAAWGMGIGSCPITVQDFDLAADVFNAEHLRAEHYRREVIAEAFLQRLHQVPVGAGEEAVEELDDRDL